jgi:hypothetical protein
VDMLFSSLKSGELRKLHHDIRKHERCLARRLPSYRVAAVFLPT